MKNKETLKKFISNFEVVDNCGYGVWRDIANIDKPCDSIGEILKDIDRAYALEDQEKTEVFVEALLISFTLGDTDFPADLIDDLDRYDLDIIRLRYVNMILATGPNQIGMNAPAIMGYILLWPCIVEFYGGVGGPYIFKEEIYSDIQEKLMKRIGDKPIYDEGQRLFLEYRLYTEDELPLSADEYPLF